MITTLALDGYDILANGITPLEGSSLTPARIADAGKADQKSGDSSSADDYLEAPFALRLQVEAATANAVKAAVTDLTLRFKPDAKLTAAEDFSPSLDTYLVEVEVDSEEYYGTAAIVTFTGTRNPFWHGPWKSLTPLAVPCWGTYDVAESIDGEVEAEVILRATSPQATEFLGVAVKHNPGAAYDAVDDYSGASSAVCVGGEKSADLTLNATPTAVATAPTINVTDNEGNALLACRAVTSDAANTYAAVSAATASVGALVSVAEPTITTPSAALRGMVLGRVKVPVTPMPSPGSGSLWIAAAGISQTSGSAMTTETDRPFQTFTLSARRKVTSVTMKATGSTGGGLVAAAYIYATSSGLPVGIPLYADTSWVSQSVGSGTPSVVSFPMDAVLEAGTYAVEFIASGCKFWRDTAAPYAGGQGGYYNGSAWVAGDGTDSTIDWYFTVDLKEEVSIGASTPVKAAGSGTTALDVVCRFPIDDFGVLVDRSASADEGFQYESGNVFVANAAGQVGGSLLGSGAQVYGKRHGLAPGVTNRVVAIADTPSNAAPSDIAVSGSYRERWVHLARSS